MAGERARAGERAATRDHPRPGHDADLGGPGCDAWGGQHVGAGERDTDGSGAVPHRPCLEQRPLADRRLCWSGASAWTQAEHAAKPNDETRHRPPAVKRYGDRSSMTIRDSTSSSTMTGSSRSRIRIPLKI